MRGWSIEVAISLALGRSPVRTLGTLCSVCHDTELALRNQLDPAANLAKPGNRAALIMPSGDRIEANGNSSRTISTTGESLPTSTSVATCASDPQMRRDDDERPR